MKYLITIIDRETGKILYTADTDALIGAVRGDDGVVSIAHTDCSGSVLVSTLAAARLVVDTVLKGEPRKLRKLVNRVYRKMTKQQRREEKAARKMAKQFARNLRAFTKAEEDAFTKAEED